MNIILTGASGMLGQDIHHLLKLSKQQIAAFTSSTLDIRDEDAVNTALTPHENATFLINCAAYTKVDEAETQQEAAFDVNETGSRNLANWCKQHSVILIHFSTDYVFNGEKKTAYNENDPCHPINAYGHSKYAGEQAIINSNCNAYIFRVQWLFGEHGIHFIKSISRLARERDKLSIVSDQWGSPTWTMDIARAICSIMTTPLPEFGIYHLSSQGQCNWADYARLIVETLDLNCEIHDIPSSDYPTPATRPLNSRLDLNKFLSLDVYSPMTWQDSVRTFLRSRT